MEELKERLLESQISKSTYLQKSIPRFCIERGLSEYYQDQESISPPSNRKSNNIQMDSLEEVSKSSSFLSARSHNSFLEQNEERVQQQMPNIEVSVLVPQNVRQNPISEMERNPEISEVGLGSLYRSVNIPIIKFVNQEKSKVFSLNQAIYELNQKVQNFLYTLNFFINCVVRISFVLIFIVMIYQEKKFFLMGIIIGMELITMFIYTIAMIKLLHTKKDNISGKFQNSFFEKPQYEIDLDRILRKHFTFQNITDGFFKFLNPISQYKMDVKLSFLRQEIYNRIQLVLCVIPFIIIFFTFPEQFNFIDVDSYSMILAILCTQILKVTLNYLIIYISS